MDGEQQPGAGADGQGAPPVPAADQEVAPAELQGALAQPQWPGAGGAEADNRQEALKLLMNSGFIPQRVAVKCMRVCRQWRDCVNGSKKLWRRIELRPDTFCATRWWATTAPAVAAKQPKELLINATSARCDQLADILQRCVHLERLLLRSCDEPTLCALDSLAAPQQLKCLKLVCCRRVTDGAFAPLVHRIPAFKQLEELYLIGLAIGNNTMRLIGAEFTQLTTLPVTGFGHLSEDGVHYLCDGLHTQMTLRKLILDHSYNIHPYGMMYYAMEMPNLQLLSVRFIPGCTDGWRRHFMSRYQDRYDRPIDIILR